MNIKSKFYFAAAIVLCVLLTGCGIVPLQPGLADTTQSITETTSEIDEGGYPYRKRHRHQQL